MENLYTVKEAAEKLSMVEGTIRNWIYDGKLKAVKVGGSIRIPEEAIKEIIKPLEVREG